MRPGKLTSPFTSILATAFYDGPTSGYAFGTCSLFSFHMLAEDPGGNLRVFLISRMDIEEFIGLNMSKIFSSGAIQILPGSVPREFEDALLRSSNCSIEHSIVATEDLLASVSAWWPVTEAVRGNRDWHMNLAAEAVTHAIATRKPVEPD